MYSQETLGYMKKLMMSLMTVCMLFSFLPVQVQAAVSAKPISSTPNRAPASAETTILVTRLYEIRDMDMSSMGKAEKKQLRNEVKSIKSELKASGDGVYLSVGAIIIIVLLLILLL
jgi:hypothetical protein